MNMSAGRIRMFIENAACASQNISLEDDVTSGAIISNIVRAAFLDGYKRANPKALSEECQHAWNEYLGDCA